MLEIVQLVQLEEILMPVLETVAIKKSKILLLSMTSAVFTAVEVPNPITHLVGKLAPAGPMLQKETVLELLPIVPLATVEKRTFPPAVVFDDVDEPRIVQFVTRLFCAALIKRIVLVLAVADAVVFEIVSELPPLFKPLIVTLVAPFKSINGLPAVVAPETVLTPVGVTVSKVQPLLFKVAVAVPSLVSAVILTVIVLPV